MKMLLFVAVVVLIALAVLAVRRRRSSPSLPTSQTASKQPPAVSPATPPEVIDLLSAFDLRERDTKSFGPWREGEFEGTRVGFQTGDRFLIAHVGWFDADREPLTDLHLGTTSLTEPLPAEDSEQRLDDFLDEQGKPLARRYFLYSTGSDDYPQLRIPDVRDGLAAFSESVIEVGFYEGGGMHLQFDIARATVASVEVDLHYATAMARSLHEAPPVL